MDRSDEFIGLIKKLDHSDPVQVQAMIDLINQWLDDNTSPPDFQAQLIGARTHLWLDLSDLLQDSESFKKALVQLAKTLESHHIHRIDVLAFQRVFDIMLEVHALTKDIEDLNIAIRWGIVYQAYATGEYPNFASNKNKLAIALRDRYALQGNIEDLDKSIELYEEALASSTEGEENRSMLLSNLVKALRDRYTPRLKTENLDKSIYHFENAFTLTPRDAAERSWIFQRLTDDLKRRYDLNKDIKDLNQVIDLLEDELAVSSDDGIHRLNELNNLVVALRNRYEKLMHPEDLDRRIYLLEKALQLDQNPKKRESYHNELGFAYWNRYKVNQELDTLDRSILNLEKVLLRHEDYTNLNPNWSEKIADVFFARYEISKLESDFDRCLGLTRVAILNSKVDQENAQRFYKLALFYSKRYMFAKSEIDIESSLENYQSAIDRKNDFLEDSGFLNNYGNAFNLRYWCHKNQLDLDKCINILELGLQFAENGTEVFLIIQNNLAKMYIERFRIQKSLADLDRCIYLLEETLQLDQNPHTRMSYYNELGYAYWYRHQNQDSKERDAVDKSIQYFEKVISLHEDYANLNSMWLVRVSSIYYARYEIRRLESDFDRCIDLTRVAILNSESDEEKAQCFYKLAWYYYKPHIPEKIAADVDRSLQNYRAAALLKKELLNNPYFLNDYGNIFNSLYWLHKNETDLNDSINFYEQALRFAEIGTDIYQIIQRNLAPQYHERFRIQKDLDDIDRCIELYEDTIKNQFANGQSEKGLLNSLQQAYDAKYQKECCLEDLKKRIRTLNWLSRLSPPDPETRVDILLKLSSAYGAYYYRTWRSNVFVLGVLSANRAIELCAPKTQTISKSLEALSERWWERHQFFGDVDDLNKSITALEQALDELPETDYWMLDKVSMRLSTRSWLTSQSEDNERARKIQESLSKVETDSESVRRAWGVNRSIVQLRAHFLDGDFSSLRETIASFRQHLDSFPQDEEERSNRNICQLYLATALFFNSSLKSTAHELDEVIRLLTELTNEQTMNLVDASQAQALLGLSLFFRYEISGDKDDFGMAEKAFSTSLELLPDESIRWFGVYLTYIYCKLDKDLTQSDERIEIIKRLQDSSERFTGHIINYSNRMIIAEMSFEEFEASANLDYLDQAIESLESILDTHPLFSGLVATRLVSYFIKRSRATGQPPDRARMIKILLPIAEATQGIDIIKALANYLLGDLYFEPEEFKDSQTALERMAKYLEQIRSRVYFPKERSQVIEDYADGYAKLVYCCLKLNQPDKALRYAEAAKSRMLVDALHNQVTDISKLATQDDALKADLEELQKLQNEINWLLKQLSNGDQIMGLIDPNASRTRRPPEEITVELSEKRAKEEELWEILETHAPVFAMTVSAPPFYLNDAVALADEENATLINYYQHDEGWVAFVVDRSGFQVTDLPGVENLLETYQSAFSNLHSPFGKILLSCVLEEAWQVLIQPLQPWLPLQGSNLIIAPFAGLHHLPFAAFTNPEDGNCLVDHYCLKTTTSLGTLRAMRNQAQIQAEVRAKNQEMTVVGYASIPSSPSYLPAVEDEVKAISRLFSLPHPLIGEDARINDVLAQAPGSHALHFACHGMFDPKQPHHSGLMLEDGWLTVRDILTRMNLSGTDMVVMSSCLSGLSRISQGEELTGLLTAFISARAKSVVGSLWSVDDRSTAELMVKFYELIRGGKEKSAALREAQLFIREQPQWSHPYYWSPFFLTGVG